MTALLSLVPGDGRRSDGALERAVHDLRAPLTVIRGLCEILARAEAGPDTRRGLRAIDGEVTRLARGLDDLMRAPTAGMSAPVDLAALAASTVARFRWAAAERDVRLTAGGNPTWVLGDPAALSRIFDNLVGNALRHCRRSGRVRLFTASRDDWAHVTVRDDGDGVPPADREQIFLPGRRGSAPRGPGHGLGLAIARELAVAHGGTLTLDRCAGPGARFRLVLPVHDAPEGRPWTAA